MGPHEDEVVSIDIIEHRKDEVVENSSRKRKFTDEISSVKFIGKLSKNNMI